MRLGVLCVVLVAFAACPPTEPPITCADVTCDAGRCTNTDDVPVCASICNDTRCAGLPFPVCVEEGMTARCVCGATHVEVGGRCQRRTPCVPNPCVEPNRTVCDSSSGVGICRCDDNFIPGDGGCVRAEAWNCNVVHAGDVAEPDECPARARWLHLDVDASRTLFPVGDHDWFLLDVTPRGIFRFAVTGSVVADIESFTREGLIVARSAMEPALVFEAPDDGARLYVRVRGTANEDGGAYVARFTSVGLDDYADEASEALPLEPGQVSFAGEIQYPGDVDAVWLELPARKRVELGAVSGVATLELVRADGGSLLIDGTRTSVTAPTTERVLLRAVAREERMMGAFDFRVEIIGDDDFSENLLFANFVTVSGSPMSGETEVAYDSDSFWFMPQARRLYRASVASPSWVNVFDAQRNALGVVGQGTNRTWRATSSEPVSIHVSSSSPMPYQLRIEDFGFDDNSDVPTNASAVAIGSSRQGLLEFELDVDVFAIHVTAPNSIIAVELIQRVLGMQMEVTDAAGARVAISAHRLAFLGQPGTYFLAISGEANGMTPYAFTVQQSGTDDHGGFNSPTRLDGGAPMAGVIQFTGDVDAFSLETTQRHVYRVTPDCNGVECFVFASNDAGQAAQSPEAKKPTEFMAQSSGVWTVDIRPLGAFTPLPMPYVISATDLGLEDHGETAATATPLTSGLPVAGSLLWPQDVDVFTFHVTAGRKLRVSTTGAETPLVEVLSETGNRLALAVNQLEINVTSTENVAIVLSRTTPALGGYTIIATDLQP